MKQIYQNEVDKYNYLYGETEYNIETMESPHNLMAEYYLKSIKNAKKILDAGIGRGTLYNHLKPNYDMYAIEASESAIAKYHKNDKRVNNLIISDIPDHYSENEFDVVICLEVMEHLPPDTTFENIAALHYATKKYAIISVANFEDIIDGRHLHINIREFDEWDSIFSKSFNIVEKHIIKNGHNCIYLLEKIETKNNELIYSPLKTPLFSILMPCYNHANIISMSIESVLNQTYHNWELIIVNDGSTDTSAEIIQRYADQDSRIKVFHKENGGMSSAVNFGLKKAKGEWICLLASDDLFEPIALNVMQASIIGYPNIKFFHYNYFRLYGNKSIEHKESNNYDRLSLQPGDDYQNLSLLQVGEICPIAWTASKEVFETVGYYDETTDHSPDYNMWLRISSKFRLKYQDIIIAVMREHEKRVKYRLNSKLIYGAGFEAIKFINENTFDKMIVNMKCDNTLSVIKAINMALTASLNLNSIMYSGVGYIPALIDRLNEWISNSFTAEVKDWILNNYLIKTITSINQYDLPHLLKEAYSRLLLIKEVEFNYQEYDPIKCFHDNIDLLRLNNKTKEADEIMDFINYLSKKKPKKRYPDSDFPKSKQKYVNIVVLSDNDLSLTRQCINGIIENTNFNFVLTVIDNNSIDGTKKYLKGLFDKKIIKNLLLLSENISKPKRANLGYYLESEADYYLLIDSNVYIKQNNWLDIMTNTIDSIPMLSMIAYKFDDIDIPRISRIYKKEVEFADSGIIESNCILIPKNTIDFFGLWNEEYDYPGSELLDLNARINSKLHRTAYMPIKVGEKIIRNKTNYPNQIEPKLVENIKKYIEELKPFKYQSFYSEEFISQLLDQKKEGERILFQNIDIVKVKHETDNNNTNVSINHFAATPMQWIFSENKPSAVELSKAYIYANKETGELRLFVEYQYNSSSRSKDIKVAPMEDFKNLYINDDVSGKKLYINPKDLYECMAKGYNYDKAVSLIKVDNNRKPEIAFTLFYPEAYTGGTASQIRLIKELCKHGIEVTVYGSGKLNPRNDLACKYVEIVNNDYSVIKEDIIVVFSILELPKLLNDLHDKSDFISKRILHFCRGIEDYHYGTYYNNGDALKDKELFQIINSIPVGRMVISTHILEHFKNIYKQNSYVFSNYIDASIYTLRNKVRNSNTFNILTIGSPFYDKRGVLIICRAFQELLSEGYNDIKLHIVISEDITEQLKHPINQNILQFFKETDTKIYNKISAKEVATLFHNSDVYINSSFYEGFGRPSIEAMLTGTPLIQANNFGMDGIAIDGNNCLRYDPFDVEKLKTSILTIRNDHSLSDELIKNGVNTATNYINSYLDNIKKSFSEILGVELIEQYDSVQDQPLFSILIPAYNQAHLISMSIDSVLNQTYENWELIIANDGSTDNTIQVVEEYAKKDKRIKLINQKNGGPSAALNTALQNSSGDWICWLSSDDLFEPNALETMHQSILNNPNYKFLHFDYFTIQDNEGIESKQDNNRNRAKYDPTEEFQTLNFMQCNYVHGIAWTAAREVFGKVGYFDERIRYASDFDMWLRISAQYKFKYIDKVVAITREHSGADTSLFSNAGFFDSTISILNFLNENTFDKLFPNVDLSKTEGINYAIETAIRIALNLDAFMYRGVGYLPALIDRLNEWISCSLPSHVRDTVYTNIIENYVNKINKIVELPQTLKDAYNRLLKVREVKFVYQKHEPYTQFENNIKYLRSIGRDIEPYQKVDEIEMFIDKVKQNRDRQRYPDKKISMNNVNSESDGNPLISIITPTMGNRNEMLGEAIKSVIAQTYQNWEMLVINDGGPDVSDFVNSFKEPRIKYIHKQNNEGVSKTRNTAIESSSGEYIAFLDDDDIYYPNHLSAVFNKMKANAYSMAYSASNIAEQIIVNGKRITIKKYKHRDYSVSVETLLLECGIDIHGLIIKKQCIDEVGQFDEALKMGEDWDLWIRLSQKYDFLFVDEITVEYRKIIDDNTQCTSSQIKMRDAVAYIYNKYKHLAVKYPSVVGMQEQRLRYHDHLIRKESNIPNNIVGNNSKEGMPKISILIPSLYGYHLIKNCIEEIYTYYSPDKFEIIVLDGQMNDGTVELMEYYKEKGMIDLVIKRLPFETALEMAINSAKGRIKIILDPSINENEDSIEELDNAGHVLKRQNIKSFLNEWASNSSYREDKNQVNTISNDDLVSIITPTMGNRNEVLRKAINSVIAQSYQNWELLVVNDGGPDISDFINSFNEPRIKYIHKNINEGLSMARNTAIEKASGKYIAILDDDDMFYSNHLSSILNALEASGKKIGYSSVRTSEQIKVNGQFQTIHHDLDSIEDFSREKLLAYNYIKTPSIIIHRECFESCGVFNPENKFAEDWDMWIRFAQKYDFIHVDDVSAEYSIRLDDPEQMTANKAKELHYVELIYKKFAHLTNNNPEILRMQDAYRNIIDAQRITNEMVPQNIERNNKDFGKVKLSIIVPEANSYHYCKALINRIYTYPPQVKFEIIAVIDEKTTDGTNELMRYYKDRNMLQIVEVNTNKSFNDAVNLAKEISNGEQFVILDKNTMPDANFFQNTKNYSTANTSSANKLRVLTTMYGWNESGGGTMFPKSVCKELAKNNIDISVFYATHHHPESKQAYYLERKSDDGVNLFGVYNRPTVFLDPDNPLREVNDPEVVRLFSQVLDEVKPDIVHFQNFLGLSFALAKETKRRGIPTLYTPHNYHLIDPALYMINSDMKTWESVDLITQSEYVKNNPDKKSQYQQRKDAAINLLNNEIDYTLAVSTRVQQLLSALSGNINANIKVLNQINPITQKLHNEIQKTNDIVHSPIRFGFIGSVLPHKGIHNIVKAAQEINKNDAQFFIYGSGNDDYINIMKRLDTKGNVKWMGEYKQDQLPSIANNLDVAIVPSIWEDCAPLVIAENLAMKLPVLGADIGGIRDFVRDRYNGALYSYNSVDELVKLIKELINKPELIAEWRKNISLNISFESFVKHTIGIYHLLHKNKRLSDSEIQLHYLDNNIENKNMNIFSNKKRSLRAELGNIQQTNTVNIPKEDNQVDVGQAQVAENTPMNRIKLEQNLSGGFANQDAQGVLPKELPSPLRLNLGCGRDVREGFLNLDLFSTDDRVIKMDIRKLGFADNSVDLILASDVLEHFSHRETDSLLKEWGRVLKKGGILIIRCPSLRLQAKAYISGAWDADIASYMIFGGQTNPGDYHCIAFDEASIRKHLTQSGFKVLEFDEQDTPQNRGYINLNMEVISEKL